MTVCEVLKDCTPQSGFIFGLVMGIILSLFILIVYLSFIIRSLPVKHVQKKREELQSSNINLNTKRG